MMGYLIVIQTLALFSSHLIATHKIVSSVLTIILMMIVNLAVGGYMIHPSDVPDFIKWLIYLSPQKWLLPVLTRDEYSDETLSNAGGLQLCRNKQVNVDQASTKTASIGVNNDYWKFLNFLYLFAQVQHQEIIIQQPCKINGTSILADFQLLSKYHILDASDIYSSTAIGMLIAAAVLFLLTLFVFVINIGKLFKGKNKRR